MGCASSKADDLPLVALCRERTELIRAAVNHRYVLAAAHASYFRALDRVGEALNRFAAEELVTAPASPVLTLPPSEGKPPKAKSCGSSAAKGDNASNAAISSPPSPSSSSVSPFSGSHLDDECHHLDDPSCSETEERFEGSDIGGVGGEGWGSLPHSASFPAFPNANFYYMKAAPTMLSTFYQDPRGYPQSQRFGFGYGYGYGYPSFVQENTYSCEPPVAHSSGETRPPPLPPPPLQGSSWDFFNPFDSYEKMFDGYAKPRFGLGSVMSSPNSSEVREQEGIPDLEEETDPEYVKETGRQRSILQEKRVKDDDSDRFNSSVGSSEAVAVPPLDEKSSPAIPEEQEDIKMRLGSGNLKRTGEVKQKDVRNERLRFEEVVNSVIMDESLQSRDAALFIQRTRDVAEAVKEVTEQFKSAASCGEDVSKLLEVGKIQYRPRIRIFKGASMLKMKEVMCTDFVKYISVKSTNLSSTLAQLYLWEKKLYKEVKDEERLRLFYDKEYSRLKALDGRGAESSKIDSVRATISKLITKISMTIKSIDAISTRIHKLRDEELRPQLVELIHGIIGMWRSMVECHQRQFQATFEARGKTLMLSSISRQGPTAKLTSDLELELSNWCSCFGEWVSAQKAYIQSLNAWLMKWLNQEGRDEAISDGIPPFAPAIFVLSNDWRHAVEQTSEDSVLAAMRTLASNLRRLCESQDEERQRKMKADFLSKELARKLNGPYDAAAEDGGRLTHLDLMRRRIDEERAKHADAMKQIQEAASCSFKTGLIPVFQALENYSSDTLKCYAELRLSSPS